MIETGSPPNKTPIAIGDIHGCRRALESLLGLIQPATDQSIITLGDYIDRGPDSKGVINLLIEFGQSHELITLKGNHELLLEYALLGKPDYHFWISEMVGGDATLASYGGNLKNIPQSHLDFYLNAELYYETAEHIFVHGGVNPTLAMHEQNAYELLTKRFYNVQAHCSDKTIICGHTRQISGLPLSLGHSICIDTNACGGGWLTAYDPNTSQCWQANEAGDTRTFDLSTM